MYTGSGFSRNANIYLRKTLTATDLINTCHYLSLIFLPRISAQRPHPSSIPHCFPVILFPRMAFVASICWQKKRKRGFLFMYVHTCCAYKHTQEVVAGCFYFSLLTWKQPIIHGKTFTSQHFCCISESEKFAVLQ